MTRGAMSCNWIFMMALATGIPGSRRRCFANCSVLLPRAPALIDTFEAASLMPTYRLRTKRHWASARLQPAADFNRPLAALASPLSRPIEIGRRLKPAPHPLQRSRCKDQWIEFFEIPQAGEVEADGRRRSAVALFRHFHQRRNRPANHNFVDCAGMGGASMQRDCRLLDRGADPRRTTPAAIGILRRDEPIERTPDGPRQ